MINVRRLVLLSLVAVALVGCSSASREEELLTELTDMNKSQIFEKAETLYAAGKTEEARDYFSFVYDTFPNDPMGHKAALRVADTFAAKKDIASLTEARLRYRDFANRYPNDPDRDYALLMVGQTYSARQMKPDRDLSTVEEALNAYRQLLILYPNSQYYEEAESRIGKLLDVLAEHELITAQFYARNKRWMAALWRVEYLKEQYPDFERMDEADALMERVRGELADAQEHFRKMMEEKQKKAKKAQGSADDEPPAQKPE
jgi:outer membrane protein assembly factor BamD